MKNTGTRIRSALFVSVFILGLLMSTSVQGLGDDDFDRRSRMTLRLANANPKARSIARQRYQFVHRLEAKLGFGMGDGGESATYGLFPVGKADRVYLVNWNVYSNLGTPHSFILCFQRKDGKDKLVYQIPLDDTGPRTIQDIRTWNLLGYLKKDGLVVKGKISHYAMTDLTRKQDCVEYDDKIMGGFLEVSLISGNGRAEMYGVYVDPLAKDGVGPLSSQIGLYQKYGLPVSSAELPLFGITTPGDAGTRVK